MVRGKKKQMIEVSTEKSSIFQRAYFILRDDVDIKNSDCNSMAFEAKKIIEDNSTSKQRIRAKRWKNILRSIPCFTSGAIFGALICAIAFIIFFAP